MKKLIVSMLAVIMLFACAVSFASCSGQIQEGRYRYAKCDADWVTEINGSQKKKLAEVSGYESKQDYIDATTENVSEAFLGSSFAFESDGSGEFTIANQKESFTWEQDGKEIDITFEGKEAAIIFENTDFEISSGKLIAKVHDTEYNYALTIILVYELD